MGVVIAAPTLRLVVASLKTALSLASLQIGSRRAWRNGFASAYPDASFPFISAVAPMMEGASGLPSFASAFLFFEAAAMPLACRFISVVVDWNEGETQTANSRTRSRTTSPFRVQHPGMVLRFVQGRSHKLRVGNTPLSANNCQFRNRRSRVTDFFTCALREE